MAVIGVLFGTAQAFFQPAYTGLVPQTVPEDDIQGAQALGGVSRELSEFLSPALAAALVLGVSGDSVTFAFSAILLARVRTRSRGEAGERDTVLGELRQGLVAVRERAWVWGTIMAFSAAILFALAPFFVLGAAVAREVYGSEAAYGLINAAWGVGTVSGALLGSRWRPRRPMRAAMLCAIPWPGAIALYAAGPPLGLLFPVMVVSGLGIGLFGVWWETALAQRVPPHLLSRVSAWDWMGSLAFLPLGYVLAGPAADAIGDGRVLEIGGLVGMLACALGLLPRSTRTLRRIEGEPNVTGLDVPVPGLATVSP
jgi:hypothetical protein